jgi:hypothetical protein
MAVGRPPHFSSKLKSAAPCREAATPAQRLPPENLLAIIWGMAKVIPSVGQLVLSRHGKSSSERGSVMI